MTSLDVNDNEVRVDERFDVSPLRESTAPRRSGNQESRAVL